MKVRRGRREDSVEFLGLVRGLAQFERLEPPSPGAGRRLIEDIFEKRLVNLLVATDGGSLVGYALYFFSYSSFVAKPTLYLEDLFVLGNYRGMGAGFALFRACVDEAVRKKCGRMEWSVLAWNTGAQKFYEALGARRMEDWALFRLDETSLGKVPRKLA